MAVVACGPLQSSIIVACEIAAELREEVAQEGGVRDHGDALLRPCVEPLQERDGTLAAVLVRLALIA